MAFANFKKYFVGSAGPSRTYQHAKQLSSVSSA